MHNLDSELTELQAAGLMEDAAASQAIARERGLWFSIHEELRVASYVAAALVSGGVGLVVKDNYARIGPLALLLAITAGAALCYGAAIRSRLRGQERGVVGDYILLLGGLLLSAAVGFGEVQFHWLGDAWSHHLLLLAIVHLATAYALDSSLLLSLGLAAFAGWCGVEPRLGNVLHGEDLAPRLGWRAVETAAAVGCVRWAACRLRPAPDFRPTFDHFALNLAFLGALGLCTTDAYPLAALGLLAVLAALAIAQGLRSQGEAMLIYGVVYPAIGLCMLLYSRGHDGLLMATATLMILAGASLALWQLHACMRRRP